jgi:hypothetical protein
MTDTVQADNGVGLPLSGLPKSWSYDASDPPNLITSTVVYRGITYIKTYTYSGSNAISSTRYEAQP